MRRARAPACSISTTPSSRPSRRLETKARDTPAKAAQLDQILRRLRPRILIFDEFHNCLRGRRRDVEAIFAVLRRLGREYDISPALVGEAAVYDHINLTDEMASRFALAPVPRWRFGEDYLALLGSLEAALPLARASRLSDETIARAIFTLSEGLIGEIVGIVTRAATEAVRNGVEQIMSGVDRGARACPAFAPARLAAARGSAVTRSTDPAWLAIEVQPRYRDLLSGHWPVVVRPEPDELLSSWLHRLAFGNGLPREDVRTGARSGFRRLVVFRRAKLGLTHF